MLCDKGDLSLLLGDVPSERAETGARHMPLFADKRTAGNAILYSTDASWTTRIGPVEGKRCGPRNLSLRRRGKAMAYPKAAEFARATTGTMVILRDGLSLEPADARKPCLHIPAKTIEQTSFFADCIDLVQTNGTHILIHCDQTDALNVTFEAYFAQSRCA